MEAAPALPPLPVSVDYTNGKTEFGAMGNNSYGDCTAAAYYHARQIWTGVCSIEDTQTDVEVLQLYSETTGFKIGDPSTDNGAIEQRVLAYLHNTGAPLADGTRSKLLAFIEVDKRQQDDVKRTIYECGVAYIGFKVPFSVMPPGQKSPQVWDIVQNETDSIGGHAVILTGYDTDGNFDLISWGERYKMTARFFAAFVDECYAITSPEWAKATGLTPLEMSLEDLSNQMRYF